MVVSLNATLFLAASSCLEVLFVVKILHTVFNQTHGIQAAVVRRVKSCLSWPRNCGNHIRYLLFRRNLGFRENVIVSLLLMLYHLVFLIVFVSVLISLNCVWAQSDRHQYGPGPHFNLFFSAKKRSLVNDEVARLQVSWSRGFLVAYAFLSMSSLLSVQRNVLLDRARWMSPIFTWTNVLVFGCLTLYVLFPSLLSTRTLNRFYVVGMILAAAYLSPWHTGTDEMFDMALILFVCCRLPAVILCARTSLVFLCNLGFTVLTIYRASTEEMASEGTFASRYVILWTELTMCAVTVAFSFALLSVLTRKAELQVQGCNAETHFTTVSWTTINMHDTCSNVKTHWNDLRLFKALKPSLQIERDSVPTSWRGFNPFRAHVWCSGWTRFELLPHWALESIGCNASEVQQHSRLRSEFGIWSLRKHVFSTSMYHLKSS